MSLLFPRNVDDDRIRQVSAKLETVYCLLSDRDKETLQRFLKHFNGKFFISESVMERFVAEVCVATQDLTEEDARQACAFALGYVSWRQMYSRRCTRLMLDTKMGKLGRKNHRSKIKA